MHIYVHKYEKLLIQAATTRMNPKNMMLRNKSQTTKQRVMNNSMHMKHKRQNESTGIKTRTWLLMDMLEGSTGDSLVTTCSLSCCESWLQEYIYTHIYTIIEPHCTENFKCIHFDYKLYTINSHNKIRNLKRSSIVCM